MPDEVGPLVGYLPEMQELLYTLHQKRNIICRLCKIGHGSFAIIISADNGEYHIYWVDYVVLIYWSWLIPYANDTT